MRDLTRASVGFFDRCRRTIPYLFDRSLPSLEDDGFGLLRSEIGRLSSKLSPEDEREVLTPPLRLR
jgi:hypothetical protein